MSDSTGKIVQVTGPVVDVEFPPGKLPNIYSALTMSNSFINDQEDNLVVEVAMHLGENTKFLSLFSSTKAPNKLEPNLLMGSVTSQNDNGLSALFLGFA